MIICFVILLMMSYEPPTQCSDLTIDMTAKSQITYWGKITINKINLLKMAHRLQFCVDQFHHKNLFCIG